MINQPSTNGSNGRSAGGKFAKGNPGGPGNPHARHAAKLRSALFRSVKPTDLREVVKKLLEQAKAGEIASIKELLQRVLGPPEAVDLIERLSALEAQITQLIENKEGAG